MSPLRTPSGAPETDVVPEPPSHLSPPEHRRRWRWRRILAVAVLAGLTWMSISYIRALTYPGSATWSDRTVEWIRANGGNGVVNRVEQWYYTHHKPTRRDARAALAHLPPRPARTDPLPVADPWRAALPVAVHPATDHPVPGEGVWTARATTPGGRPTLETTAFRPNAGDQNMVVGVAWIDTHVLKAHLVAGTVDPGRGWPWGAEVPPAERPFLVAAFNSGFKFRDHPGGFYEGGRTGVPLLDGRASFVVGADGIATVGDWGRDMRMGPGIEAVRQNLHLIVDHGQPLGDLATNRQGFYGTRHQQMQFTWRSAVGVDRHGNLVYVAGAGLDLHTLAVALVDAGAVRAMQLDIHDGKATFNIFRPAPGPLGTVGTKLMANMQRPATRYLQPDQRDFMAFTTQ